MSNSCCHYNYTDTTKRNPMDDAPELASPSCLQVHLENIIMPKHPSPEKIMITNTPVNNIATQLQKNAWKHSEGEVRQTVGDVEEVHLWDFSWPQFSDRKYGKTIWLRCASSCSLYCNFKTFRQSPTIIS
jgi:hypothetical protein